MPVQNPIASSAVNEEKGVNTASNATAEKSAYVAPRIMTHSAEKLQQASHPVNACVSFIP